MGREKFNRTIFFISLLLSFICGCSDSDDSNSSATTLPQILNKTWKLQRYGKSGEGNKLASSTQITIIFNEDNTVRGSGGCNTYGANFDIDSAGTLSVKNLFSTEMACLTPGALEQETLYFQVLQEVTTYELASDSLKLFYDAAKSSLIFQTSE
ncbi:META domain-containing protein [Candidatus Riflebacteria bacterium]